MITIDLSDWQRLANEYGQRIRKLRSPNPFGAAVTADITKAVRMALYRQLLMGTQSLKKQQAYFAREGHGMYGPHGGFDPKIVNPQEFLGGRSGGGMYKQSHIDLSFEGGSTTFNLVTDAKMDPYGTTPEGPLPKLLRTGWTSTVQTKTGAKQRAMVPRPFGKWLASSYRTLLGYFQTGLLQNIGFRRK